MSYNSLKLLSFISGFRNLGSIFFVDVKVGLVIKFFKIKYIYFFNVEVS